VQRNSLRGAVLSAVTLSVVGAHLVTVPAAYAGAPSRARDRVPERAKPTIHLTIPHLVTHQSGRALNPPKRTVEYRALGEITDWIDHRPDEPGLELAAEVTPMVNGHNRPFRLHRIGTKVVYFEPRPTNEEATPRIFELAGFEQDFAGVLTALGLDSADTAQRIRIRQIDPGQVFQRPEPDPFAQVPISAVNFPMLTGNWNGRWGPAR